MPASLVIAARILRQRIRDRSAIIFAVITPLALATAFALLVAPATTTFHTAYVVYDADGGAEAGVLIDKVLGSLAAAKVADVERVPTEAAARAAVDANQASVAFLVPAGFTADIQAGKTVTLPLVTRDAPTAVRIATSAVDRFAAMVGRARLAVATTMATASGPLPSSVPGAVAQEALASDPIAITATSTQRLQANVVTFYGASMAIMFLFFATQYGMLSLIGERRTGTLGRLLVAPIRPWSVILGAALASFALGLLSMTIMVVATSLMLGATWGPPALVALLVLSAVTAATGISTLVCSFGKTEEQAGSANVIVALVLAVLGGTFIALSQAPEILARISLITPHAWFLRAIDTMAGSSVSLADIAPSFLVLVAMGLITGALGLVRARRVLVAR
jgi:linearmycin/streptolysin S transport system permease protein